MSRTQIAPITRALFLCSLVLVLAGLACNAVGNRTGSAALPVLATKPPGQPAGAGAGPVLATPPPAVAGSSPFRDSDCACLGLPLASSENDGKGLSCNYEWDVTIGDTHDTNQAQLYIDPWQSEEAALSQLKSEAQTLGSPGGEISMEGNRDLYYIEKRGDAGFFYGELRVVFPQGYYLGTHLRGTFSGADEVSSILHTAKQCMLTALER